MMPPLVPVPSTVVRVCADLAEDRANEYLDRAGALAPVSERAARVAARDGENMARLAAALRAAAAGELVDWTEVRR